MILVIDFGSQFSRLIVRRLREQNFESHIVSCFKGLEEAKEMQKKGVLKGIVLSGGPHSVYEEKSPDISKEIYGLNVPVLGICYGLQLINKHFGGKVVAAKQREYGAQEIKVTGSLKKGHPLSAWLQKLNKDQHTVWMSHGDEINQLGAELECVAKSHDNAVSAVQHKTQPIFGLQFHPEVEHTTLGNELLGVFAEQACAAPKNWQTSNLVEQVRASLRAQLENDKDGILICALSGGVDSSVAAVLCHQAFPGRLKCVFVDNGLLRKNEYEEVLKTYKTHLGLDVTGFDAKDMFLSRLKDVSDPEKKRKIIGASFIDVFEEFSKSIKNARYLVQGTLYTDVIESVPTTGTSVTIKSHHNVGGLPEKLNFKLVEPLREFFKDEVRRIGRALDIPETLIGRHPFPGPGLAVRILGALDAQKVSVLQEADAILREELHSQSLYSKVWQAAAILLPVHTTGVMGDGRTFENVCAIRCVNSSDGMTADWSKLPHEFLDKVSRRITNEVRGINRVVYDITSKPPATIEWE